MSEERDNIEGAAEAADTPARPEAVMPARPEGDMPAEPEAEALAFEVTAEEAGARLDAFLAARVEGVSRSTLKRVIDDGDALVSGRAAKPSHKLKAGDRVEV
ncbi:MAG TPA: S4 domain-containing protein, partial [Pyrinomonadaceae bacterium]